MMERLPSFLEMASMTADSKTSWSSPSVRLPWSRAYCAMVAFARQPVVGGSPSLPRRPVARDVHYTEIPRVDESTYGSSTRAEVLPRFTTATQ